MIWELGVSCALVFVGHARTLYRTWRVNSADDYEGYMDSYDGPLVDRTDPAWHKAAAEDHRREVDKIETIHAAERAGLLKEIETAYKMTTKSHRSPMIVMPPATFFTATAEPAVQPESYWWATDSPDMGNGMVNPLGRPPMCEGPPKAEAKPYVDALHEMLTSHTCHACGRTSFNENDARHGYCGWCHHFCRDAGERFA
jgi:hypothetical protein